MTTPKPERLFQLIRGSAKILFAALAFTLSLPLMAAGQPVTDLTAFFTRGGVTIERLAVYEVGGIVLIRGRTDDAEKAADAGRFAVLHGYRRVANLIEIVPGIGDDGVARLARYRLEMSRELVGCTFQLDSVGGILRLAGQVRHESQKGFAIHLVSKIDGVREVRSALTLSAPKSQGGQR